MSLRGIVTWPDEVLSEVCAPVEQITDEVRELAGDMLETMYAAPGRGLAAVQVGITLRLFVMDAGWKDAAPAPMIFVNPHIIAQSEMQVTRFEGCLSIPGITVEVARPERVEVRWTDLDGVVHEREFDGFEAACVQHEIDHLDGTVTLERISPETRARVLSSYARASE